MVTHGCIDGHSRCVTFLHCGRDNKKETVLNLFVQATVHYGLPSRTRSDHGGENFYVALFMELIQGTDRSSHITGESKHNQRIERLWVDVFTQVISYFYKTFYELEDKDRLDPANSVHIFALQEVFLPEINRRLKIFQKAWNSHSLRTANHQSPEQMWIAGMLRNINADSRSTDTVFGEVPNLETDLETSLNKYGLSIEDFSSQEHDTESSPVAVEVSPTTINISRDELSNIHDSLKDIQDLEEKYVQMVRRLL